MKRPLLLSMFCLAGLGGASVAPSMAAEQSAPMPVLAHDLKELGAWAQWTRRVGYCTVQIILSAPPGLGGRTVVNSGTATPTTPKPKVHDTQVWLLRADGTAMPMLRSATELPKTPRETTATYTFAFPESATREAAAVAVMIDGRYFVEKLRPFPDEK